MSMLRKSLFCLLSVTISGYACANIVELDAFNPDHCRQQILKSADELPVIASYESGRRDSESFMNKFELLAKEHPERTFFKWDATKDGYHATQTLCLQQLGFTMQPSIILLAVVKYENSEKPIMSSPLRLYWAGEMSLLEMNAFIDVDELKMKKAVLKQNSH